MSSYCDICGRIGGHLDECPNNPNYTEKIHKSDKYCDSCGEKIQYGELYIEDNYGNYSHINCFDGYDDLCKWIDIPIYKEGCV